MTAKPYIPHGVMEALRSLPFFLTAPLCRPWHLRWGATDAEVQGMMPGDEIVPNASFNATRAITIAAPIERVWPWIVQIGYRRAGFYTYDLLDNGGQTSADQILGQFQQPKLGDWMPMTSSVNATTAFKVRAFLTNRWLLWEKPDSTWAWTLTPLAGGQTRLITRLKQRYPWEAPAMALFTLLLLEFGDFPMMRRMLQGIKARAEQVGSGVATAEATVPMRSEAAR